MDIALGLPDVMKVMHFPGWSKPVTQDLPELEAKGLNQLRNEGVKISEYPPDVSTRFKSATDAVLAEWKDDPFSAQIVASYDRFR